MSMKRRFRMNIYCNLISFMLIGEVFFSKPNLIFVNYSTRIEEGRVILYGLEETYMGEFNLPRMQEVCINVLFGYLLVTISIYCVS